MILLPRFRPTTPAIAAARLASCLSNCFVRDFASSYLGNTLRGDVLARRIVRSFFVVLLGTIPFTCACSNHASDHQYAKFQRLFRSVGTTTRGILLRVDFRSTSHRSLLVDLATATALEHRASILVTDGLRIATLDKVLASAHALTGSSRLVPQDIASLDEFTRHEIVGVASGGHLFHLRQADLDGALALIALVSLDHRALHSREGGLSSELRNHVTTTYASASLATDDGIMLAFFPDICVDCPSGSAWSDILDRTRSERVVAFLPFGLTDLPGVDVGRKETIELVRYPPTDPTLRRLVVESSLLGLEFPIVWERDAE